MPKKTTDLAMTVALSLYPREIEALDKLCEEEERSRSGMVRRLISQEVARRAEAEREAA